MLSFSFLNVYLRTIFVFYRTNKERFPAKLLSKSVFSAYIMCAFVCCVPSFVICPNLVQNTTVFCSSYFILSHVPFSFSNHWPYADEKFHCIFFFCCVFCSSFQSCHHSQNFSLNSEDTTAGQSNGKCTKELGFKYFFLFIYFNFLFQNQVQLTKF